MPKITMEIPHALGAEKAADRLKTLVDHLRASQKGGASDVEEKWEGNVLNFGFTTFGLRMHGLLTVHDSSVDLDFDIPFAAVMFRGKIESEMREQLERILS